MRFKILRTVYIRPGSITQPYKLELAEIDRIEYMLKSREDSQITAQTNY